jgi:hypothetical protein
MTTLGWLVYIAGAVTGWLIHRAFIDGLMAAQEATHKHQMDEIFEEVKRLRAQVAMMVGRE